VSTKPSTEGVELSIHNWLSQTKQAFTQKNRITVQPALNVQSIQVDGTAPEIQLGELKLILKDPIVSFWTERIDK
jgi:hypothetical protein